MNLLAIFIAASLGALSANDSCVGGPICNGSRDTPWIALTFDACPARRVNDVIKVIEQTQTPATFFLSGRWVAKHDTLTRELAALPCVAIENHSWSHADFRGLTPARIRDEIMRSNGMIESVSARKSGYFRFPFGSWKRSAVAGVAGLGLTAVQWDVVSGDANPGLSARSIARTVLQSARNGSIIVMHVNGRCRHTADALKLIIDGLEERGFKLVTIPKLLNTADTAAQHAMVK